MLFRSMAVTMVIMQFLYTGVSMLGGDRYVVVILTGVILIGILLLNTLLDLHAKKKGNFSYEKQQRGVSSGGICPAKQVR